MFPRVPLLKYDQNTKKIILGSFQPKLMLKFELELELNLTQKPLKFEFWPKMAIF